ncbi:flavodoxin family protein [Heliomicrobium modesticaldum]|nr:flavodoxin family protein [Heliomicrobium modesticaldum]
MKIVALMGSPRKGANTEALVQEAVRGAEEKGAHVKQYHLNEMQIKGCQSCFGCKRQENCVVRDEAAAILEDIKDAKAVIFGTPVYMWQMTGQLKLLVDRLFSFMNADYSSKLTLGKKVLWAVTQGQPDKGAFMPYFENAGKMLQMVGFGEYKIVAAGRCGMPGDVEKQKETLEEARALGRWLAE